MTESPSPNPTTIENPDPAIPPPAEEHILQFFAYDHLPEHLAAISAPFSGMAKLMVEALPRNPERTVTLRKLLEAKDAAVRAKLAK
jgi:hypothetical protein